MPKKYLLYISQNYSFEILRPLQVEILSRGDDCAWFVEGDAVNTDLFSAHENVLPTIKATVHYKPDVVFVPGNIIPEFISGLKVQVFHGLEYKKKGHFRIRGFFDLYCTHGPITTNRFQQLKQKHKHFNVIETGWSKLDPLFTTEKHEFTDQGDRPCILYAPTFSPNLTSSIDLLPEIERLAKQCSYFWVIKFHPKMGPELVLPYRKLAEKHSNIVISTESTVAPLLQTADVIVSDTSSIIGEFILLGKPAVTYKNSSPGNELLNFTTPELLADRINIALTMPRELKEQLELSNLQLHPYKDGKSSQRILDAVDAMLTMKKQGLKRKPLNLLRKLKIRKRLGYWMW